MVQLRLEGLRLGVVSNLELRAERGNRVHDRFWSWRRNLR
jgi:hypothetical protein